jgi:alpha-1,6-mannosyltransferase
VSALPAGYVLLGLAGSVLLTLTASRLADRRFHWWFRVVINPIAIERVLFYVGMVALVLAWLGLGRFAHAGRWRSWGVTAAALIWSVPLLIGPPLFSHDLFSYLAQGSIAHLGLNPYHSAPVVLARHGYGHVLAGVDPFWSRATAPYGPLFVGVSSLIVAITGSHVFAGVMVVRLFDLVGLVLLAVFVPRLGRRLGADPVRATWLAVASPLILLQLVAPGHNDLLMAGLMVGGVSLALERTPLLGIIVCTIAATVKLPALAAALFIAVVWCRDAGSRRDAVLTAGKAIAAAVATAAIITLVTGFGVGWISTSLFSTPGRVRLAITPATDISYTVAKVIGGTGTFSEVESVLRAILFGLSMIIGLVLVSKARWRTLAPYLGLTLVAFAFGGPALWPWYLAWGLVLLAAWRPAQRSWTLVTGIVLASFVVRPDGILLLSRGSSPIVAGFWVVIGILAWIRWRRRPPQVARPSEYPDGLGSAQSALARR